MDLSSHNLMMGLAVHLQGRKDKSTQSSEQREAEITQPTQPLTSYLTSRDHWLQFKPN